MAAQGVNLNEAGLDELQPIKYIGPKKANMIIDYRRKLKGEGKSLSAEEMRPLITKWKWPKYRLDELIKSGEINFCHTSHHPAIHESNGVDTECLVNEESNMSHNPEQPNNKAKTLGDNLNPNGTEFNTVESEETSDIKKECVLENQCRAQIMQIKYRQLAQHALHSRPFHQIITFRST